MKCKNHTLPNVLVRLKTNLIYRQMIYLLHDYILIFYAHTIKTQFHNNRLKYISIRWKNMHLVCNVLFHYKCLNIGVTKRISLQHKSNSSAKYIFTLGVVSFNIAYPLARGYLNLVIIRFVECLNIL